MIYPLQKRHHRRKENKMLNSKSAIGPLGGAVLSTFFRVTFADATAVARKLGQTIRATSAEPIAYRVTVINVVASNAATSHALAVGITGSAYTDIIAAADLKAAVGTNTAAGSNPIRIARADTEIYIKPTIVGTPTAGEALVCVETWPVEITG